MMEWIWVWHVGFKFNKCDSSGDLNLTFGSSADAQPLDNQYLVEVERLQLHRGQLSSQVPPHIEKNLNIEGTGE